MKRHTLQGRCVGYWSESHEISDKTQKFIFEKLGRHSNEENIKRFIQCCESHIGSYLSYTRNVDYQKWPGGHEEEHSRNLIGLLHSALNKSNTRIHELNDPALYLLGKQINYDLMKSGISLNGQSGLEWLSGVLRIIESSCEKTENYFSTDKRGKKDKAKNDRLKFTISHIKKSFQEIAPALSVTGKEDSPFREIIDKLLEEINESVDVKNLMKSGGDK